MAPSDRTVVWSPEAEQDILDNWRYLAEQASTLVADRQLKSIEATCHSLTKMPFRGRPRGELRPGLRSVLVGSYVAFYRVAATTIDIVRVVHQRRDIQAIFTAT